MLGCPIYYFVLFFIFSFFFSFFLFINIVVVFVVLDVVFRRLRLRHRLRRRRLRLRLLLFIFFFFIFFSLLLCFFFFFLFLFLHLILSLLSPSALKTPTFLPYIEASRVEPFSCAMAHFLVVKAMASDNRSYRLGAFRCYLHVALQGLAYLYDVLIIFLGSLTTQTGKLLRTCMRVLFFLRSQKTITMMNV